VDSSILAVLGSDPGAVTNPAVVVVREGIEAVLILASLTAGWRRNTPSVLRMALFGGVMFAGVATLLTWLGVAAVVSRLAGYGEVLDAAISIFSVLLLLLVTNWFFHRVYWTGWVAGFHARKHRSLSAGRGRLTGMVLLGFISTYREGFETVVFLQALSLQTSRSAVSAGALIGIAVVLLAGTLILGVRLRLPYKKMLVATGLMISLVLVVMVGNTVAAMQDVGWATKHMLQVRVPGWATLWLGVHGSAEAVVAQLAAAVVVFGSYWLAERQHGQPRRALSTTEVSLPASE
jgi:high-affinity iron transporter